MAICLVILGFTGDATAQEQGDPTGWRSCFTEKSGVLLKNWLAENLNRIAVDKTAVVTVPEASRYRLIREYDPAGFAKVKKLISTNRWTVGQPVVTRFDPRLLSTESCLRQGLYASRWLQQETGQALFTLPDSLLKPASFTGGALTSQAFLKRWNRANEVLAGAVEPLAVTAFWLGSKPYPQQTLSNAEWLLLSNQENVILQGSTLPETYGIAWNNEALCSNLLTSQLGSSAAGVIRAMDTRTKGIPLVVYNPLPYEREEAVEAEVTFPEGTPDEIVVVDPEWKPVPFQVISRTKTTARILFLAKLPSLGLACFGVEGVKEPQPVKNGLICKPNVLENEFYKVIVNPAGDLSSVIDKKQNKELLTAPARLEFLREHPESMPSLSMDWNDRKEPAAGFVDGTAVITLTEQGPVRAALTIERTARNSRFVQTIRLTAGNSGRRIEVLNRVEWQSKGVSLKASFLFSAANPQATASTSSGIAPAANNAPGNVEQASAGWIDLTDKSSAYGISLLNNGCYGFDKPNDKTLRLTLLYTPAVNSDFDQATQDWGNHTFTYALYAHKGDWKTGSAVQAQLLNNPVIAFQTTPHPGTLGNTFSFLKMNLPSANLLTLKKAENSDNILLRLMENSGAESAVEVTFPAKILAASETDLYERTIGDPLPAGMKLTVRLKPFEIKSFSVQLAEPETKFTGIPAVPVALAFDQDVVSAETNRKGGRFDPDPRSLPAEQFPATLTFCGIPFNLGSTAEGKNNAIACRGQKITLPKTGNYNKVCLLVAASSDTSALFRAAEGKQTIPVRGFSSLTGQGAVRHRDPFGRITGVATEFLHTEPVAWFSTHLHRDTLNLPFQNGCLYYASLPASPATGTLQLPDNPSVRIFALTVAQDLSEPVRVVSPEWTAFRDLKNLSLQLPPRYYTASSQPAGTVTVVVKQDLSALPWKVTRKDYADLQMPNGVTAKYYYTGTEKRTGKLPENGGMVQAVNDGMFDLLPGDSLRNLQFENGEGRIVMDLQKSLAIDSLHLFTDTSPRTGPLFFSVWINDKPGEPAVSGDPVKGGWTLLGVAGPSVVKGTGKSVLSLSPKKEKSFQGRYLMFITEECSHGPFFLREADVFEHQ